MMATRNPKVVPKKSSVKAKRKEPAKEQAWTDTDDTETTKESGDLTEQAKDSSEQSEPSEQSVLQKGTGSIISVREAPDSEKDPLEGPSDLETNGVSKVNGISNGVGEQYPMTTDTELPYGTETDSMGSVESGTKRRIKRNTVAPTDGEDTSAGRQTPESETRKDAWSAAEADISESDVPPSRPSSAAAMYRQALTKSRSRPATAPGKKPLPLPLERPMTAPSSALTNKNKAIKLDSNLYNDPVPSTSGVELDQQDKTLAKWSSDKQLELTNAEAKESWTMDIVKEGTRDGASTVSSCDLLAPPKISGEQNAYIPFFYARECIQKVMDDMKRMKANHIKVIDQIQDQYRLIEDEIQGKFNTFVIGLRTQYSDKVATFRHVIEIHREDTNSKQQYWQDTVKSLQAKTRKLLQDKRELMIKNRDEFNKLEEEKTKAIKDLTDMLDAKHVKYTAMLKDLKNERNKALELEERLQALEEQNKKLKEDFDSNKGTHEQELTVIKAKHEEQLQEQKQQLDLLLKEKDEALEKEKKAKEESSEEERKRLTEENQKHLADIEAKELELKSLREELEQLKSAGAIAVSADVVTTTLATSAAVETKELKEESQEEVKERAEGETTEPKVVTVTTTVHDTKEIAKLTEEKNKLNEEKTKIEEELKNFEEEVAKVKEELENEKQIVIKLQEENSQLGKEKTRFEKHATENKQEIRELRLQCTSLREQLQGLLEATAQTKDDKEAEEKLQAAENEKKALEEQQAKMKEEFEKWKEQFQAEHDGEEPSEDDRSEEIQEMIEKLKEEEERLKKAENTIAVMTMLKEGSVPETLPTVASGVSNNRLEELEDRINKLEEERDSLEVKIETLQKEKDNEVEKLSNENDSLNEKNFSLEEKIAELNSENEELKVELSEARDSVPMSPPSPVLAVEGEDVSEMSSRLVELQDELTKASQELEQEKAERLARVDELDALKQELEALKEGSAGDADNLRAELNSTKESLEAEIETKNKDVQEAKKRIEELEQKLMANVPVDTAKEMKSYQERLAVLQKEKETLTKENLTQKASVTTLNAKIETLNNNLERQKNNEKDLQETNKKMRLEKEKEIKEAKEKAESKSKQKIEENNKMIQMLQKRIKELEASGVPHGEAKVDVSSPRRKDSKAVDPEKLAKEKEKLLAQIDALKKAAQEDHKRIKALEKEAKDAAKNAKPAGPSAEDRAASKKMEKQLKDAQKNLEMEKKKFEKVKETLAKTEEEFKELKKEHDSLIAESKKDKADLAKLGVAAEEGLAAQEKVEELTKEVKSLRDENKTLSDNYNSERILRKKYYNMVEDMKGKIRVYCRARPLSKTENERGNHSVIKSPDEYSIVVSTSRGPKDFNFDQVFTPDHGQERVFEDTNNLIQSAVDGYNVCIFAYGQTGSGKTFTMIGDKEGNFPGIAPRAMEAIYRLIDENKKKFSFKVHTYMLELYNDKLIDLLAPANKEPAKLDIKKDKKGLVFVTGSVMLEAATKDELWSIFERGSENRHVSSTKMNAESSRSHLILGIVIESTNLTSGAVVKGKLSLVDLAGSERAAKTGATPEQLKEAQSINKSLSALGDVISALSSDQSFIPYRNNKLTLLMQDSLGGNAKTLMFVNISPADYNTDETITSLTYASRVKLITNDAQKNSDNKEIARLKGIISKLKKGEDLEEDID